MEREDVHRGREAERLPERAASRVRGRDLDLDAARAVLAEPRERGAGQRPAGTAAPRLLAHEQQVDGTALRLAEGRAPRERGRHEADASTRTALRDAQVAGGVAEP